MICKDFKVSRIGYEDTKDFILNKHYARRMPSISYSYGIFDNSSDLIGVLTIGKPVSNALCEGVCGKEYKSKVFELNRLVVNDGLPKNTLSYFVGQVLKDLKILDLILVSYSDMGMSHHGYIYQATNWIYTGATRTRTDKYTPKGKHSRHYTDEHNHLRKVRSSKHRYVYFTGTSRKMFLDILKYKIEDYPKGNNEYYKLGEKQRAKIIDNKNNTTYYE